MRGAMRSGSWSLVAFGLVALASCTLAPDHCLRMSDCGDGTVCVEGLCRGPSAMGAGPEAGTGASSAASTTTSTTIDGGASTDGAAAADGAAQADAHTDADASADASDDASDGAMTDDASVR